MTRLALLGLAAALAIVSPAGAIDLELFEFGDANDTQLTAAANTANPGNGWFYDEEATALNPQAPPTFDAGTGDVSTVQSGAYRVVTDSGFDAGIESRYLDIDNVTSGKVFLEATLSSWQFNALAMGGNPPVPIIEQLRFTFLNDDTGNSGNVVTAQMQVRRNAATGAMELFGDAVGTAGSFNIARTVELPNNQSAPFTMVLAVDKDSNSYEVFYKDGSNPSQSLGLGGVSRARDANSIRMVTANFGAENIPDFNVFTEFVNVDRFAVSTTNPLTDLVTLEINRETGAMTLVNNSGSAVTGVTGVTLESATGSVDLSQLDDFSGTLAAGQSVALDSSPGSSPGLWLQSPVEDVYAELTVSGGDARSLDVDFVGNGGVKWQTGDLDFDGAIDEGDYLILTANAESDLSSLTFTEAYLAGDLNGDGFNDSVDFGLFKADFIAANGAAAFARLVTGVPEPGAAILLMTGVASLLSRGRRRRERTASQGQAPRQALPRRAAPMNPHRTPTLTVLVAAACLLAAGSAEAIIFEDFTFDDPAGTLIPDLANSTNPGSQFTEDDDTLDVATNGLGQLDASLKANEGFGTNFLDVEPALTSGTIFGVMELTWDFAPVLNPGEVEEQVRISLINNNPTGTEITGEFRIVRTASNEIAINGQAGGTGSSDLPNTVLNGGSLTQTDKFIAVVAANLDDSTYEILYSNDAGASFLSAGVGQSASGRIVESMRMTLNNDLSADNVLIDRVYLADELPIFVEPDKLTLYVHPKSGHAAIVNDTGTTFDIDYYRVQSGDDSLLEDAWVSLQDRATDAVDGPDGGSTAGDGVGETWTEAGGSDAGVLSESFLLSSSLVSENDALPLGGAVDLAGDETLLTFEYRDAANGNLFGGLVVVGELLAGDYNLDGAVDAADYTVWRDNASGLFTPADYTVWANNFGATFGAAAAVPEPATIVLAGLVVAVHPRRRRVSP